MEVGMGPADAFGDEVNITRKEAHTLRSAGFLTIKFQIADDILNDMSFDFYII